MNKLAVWRSGSIVRRIDKEYHVQYKRMGDGWVHNKRQLGKLSLESLWGR